MQSPRSITAQPGCAARLACAALLGCAALGCIERPFQEQPQQAARASVDRGALRDVILSAPPADLTPVGALFGGTAELLGYKLEPPQLVGGQRARLTLFWKCRGEMDAWHIFVHLDDANGSGERIHAEHDPAGGRYPTDAWKPGDVIVDSFTFVPTRSSLLLYLGFFSQGESRLPLNSAGRGRDDGNGRLLAGMLSQAK